MGKPQTIIDDAEAFASGRKSGTIPEGAEITPGEIDEIRKRAIDAASVMMIERQRATAAAEYAARDAYNAGYIRGINAK